MNWHETALLQTIRLDPSDQVARGILADHFEQEGRGDEARYLRIADRRLTLMYGGIIPATAKVVERHEWYQPYAKDVCRVLFMTWRNVLIRITGQISVWDAETMRDCIAALNQIIKDMSRVGKGDRSWRTSSDQWPIMVKWGNSCVVAGLRNLHMYWSVHQEDINTDPHFVALVRSLLSGDFAS